MNFNRLESQPTEASARPTGSNSVVVREDGLISLQAKLAEARQTGTALQISQLLDEIGQIHQVQKRWQEAIACYREKLEIGRSQQNPEMIGRSLNQLGQIYQAQGHWSDALMRYQQSLTIQEQLGDRQGQAETLINMALVHTQQEMYPESLPYFQAALDLLPPHSTKAMEVRGLLETAQAKPTKPHRRPSHSIFNNFTTLLIAMVAVPLGLLASTMLLASHAWIFWLACMILAVLARLWVVRSSRH